MATVASPQTYSGLLGADFRLAAMIEAQIRMQLSDMSSLRNFGGLITYAGDITGTGSDSIRLRYSNIGKTPFVSTADGSPASGSTIDATTATIAVGRSALVYNITDLAVMTGLGADLDPFSIAERMAFSAEKRINEVICSTFTNATASVGSSGVDMSVQDFMDALYALELKANPAPFMCVLHPRQLADFQASMRSENNNFLAFTPATAGMAGAKSPGYVGDYLGVSIFQNDYVQKDATLADYEGLMFSQGGVGYATGSPQPLAGAVAELRPAGTPVTIAFERNEASGITNIVGHLYCGASILEQDRCVKIVTDA